jgi:DNA-binding transcriptional LysR family regulator
LRGFFGAALLKRGIAVFDELREGVKDLEYLADPGAGEIRIGAIPPLAATFVSSVADQLVRRHPRIVVHLIALSTDQLYDELRERKLDLLVARRMNALVDEQASPVSR